MQRRGLLSYQSIGNSEQEMRRTTVIPPPTLICQVTPAQLPCSNPKTHCWSGFTRLLPLYKLEKWGRPLLYLVENSSQAGLVRNLHISNHKCVFVSEAAPPSFTVLICCLCLELERKWRRGQQRQRGNVK